MLRTTSAEILCERKSKMDTFEKLEYRIKAGITEAKDEKERRLSDRLKLPLEGLHGEQVYITGLKELTKKAQQLRKVYEDVPKSNRVVSVILLDAHSSATIEGAHTTVERMKHCLTSPETKDEMMVANTYKGCIFAYEHQIKENNIRKLWDIIVKDVCENKKYAGTLYRDGMVFIGNENETAHEPAQVKDIPRLMKDLFAFDNGFDLDPLIKSFVFHFYLVYVHPFCDGNGRIARTINSSQLYHSGYEKVKSIAMATAINKNLSSYYRSIRDCEIVINKSGSNKWLDLAPFIDYMQKIFEDSMINAKLANNVLSESQSRILDRMNKVGPNAEITVQKAMTITGLSDSGARKALNKLANEGYLIIDKSRRKYVYVLGRRPEFMGGG